VIVSGPLQENNAQAQAATSVALEGLTLARNPGLLAIALRCGLLFGFLDQCLGTFGTGLPVIIAG
jgi:hypothetical protein